MNSKHDRAGHVAQRKDPPNDPDGPSSLGGERIQDSEELERLFRLAPLPYHVLDRQGRLRDVNQAWLEMFGHARAEVLGRPFQDFLAPSCKERFTTHTEAASSHESAEGMEITMLHKTGRHILTRYFDKHVHDDQGSVSQSYCLLEDIRRSKRLEQSLMEAQERYKTIVEQQNDMVVAFDPEGRLRFVSPAYCQTFGVDPREILGKTFMGLILEDDRKTVSDSLASLRPDKPSTYHEERVMTRQGLRWLGWSAKGIFDEEDRLQEVISVGRDITDRKRAQQALDDLLAELEERVKERTAELEKANARLRQKAEERSQAMRLLELSEHKYRTLHESIRDGVAVVDQNGIITDSNKAFRNMLGYTGEELHGLREKELSPPAWHELQEAILDEQVLAPDARGYSEVYEKEYLRKDEKTFPVEMRSHLVHDEDGNPAGYWAIVRDITPRKQIEAAMRQAQYAAEAANRAKSSFLARMSHELRTPLNAIINLSELAAGEDDATLRKEYIQAVAESGRRLHGLVDVVLDYARLDNGALELEHRDFNLHDVLAQVIAVYQPQAQDKGLAMDLRFGKHLQRHFKGDPLRLQQVLLNVVGNALKYTQQGGVTISVSCVNGACDLENAPPTAPDDDTSSNRSVLSITVEDSGSGIAPEKMESLFEAFASGDDTLTSLHDGAGLGLPLSKGLLELMGGHIECHSVLGTGTRIQIELPLELAPSNEAFQQAAPFPPPGKQNGFANGKTALDLSGALTRFGDDDALYLETGEEILTTLAGQMEELQHATLRDDYETVTLLIHSFQNNCAILGAERCMRLLLNLENAAREKHRETLLMLLAEISTAVDEIRKEFAAFKATREEIRGKK